MSPSAAPPTVGVRQAVWDAVAKAALAPSIHNTQPWAFVLDGPVISMRSEPSRRLQVLDPLGRQMTMSIGCALLNLRVAIAAAGYRARVDRFPEPADPQLVARVTLVEPSSGAGPDLLLAELDGAVARRRTNRRAFAAEALPKHLLKRLTEAVTAEQVVLVAVEQPAHRQAVARLTRLANELEESDPAYIAELRAWTTDDLRRKDGVQAFSAPSSPPAGRVRDELPLRDFDTRHMGWLPSHVGSDAGQYLFVLASRDTTRTGWLHAGEALERLWLVATTHEVALSPITQAVEVATTHDALRSELGLSVDPLAVLRIGRAPRTEPTRRRDLRDMIIGPGRSRPCHGRPVTPSCSARTSWPCDRTSAGPATALSASSAPRGRRAVTSASWLRLSSSTRTGWCSYPNAHRQKLSPLRGSCGAGRSAAV